MKIFVIVDSYPSLSNPYPMAYVHSRNIVYRHLGHDVQVLSLTASQPYEYEGIRVSPFDSNVLESSDIILSHAPTKWHYYNLKKLKNKKICFFYHGHEVLYIYGDYPKPYKWVKTSLKEIVLSKVSDAIKIVRIRLLLCKISKENNLGFVFVSEWMERQFKKNIKINPEDLGLKSIIHNACNPIFFKKKYTFNSSDYEADFITIRPLDKSKYAIDLVVDFAKNNPDKKFHIYGKGDYFIYNEKPENIKIIDKFIQQQDIPLLLNKYKFAIMPTRYDSQGVMVCEMATFGIPLVTTNFEVCVEMLENFENVVFLNENDFRITKIEDLNIKTEKKLNDKFDPLKLINMELNFFEEIKKM